MKFGPFFNVLLLSLLLLYSCRNDRSKDDHDRTSRVCDSSFFVETFTVFGGGAWGGDMVSQYLTDSTNFRIYIGTYDNAHEAYSYECQGDTITVYRTEADSTGKRRITTTIFHSIADLRKSKKFE
jgi:hypothetical protein